MNSRIRFFIMTLIWVTIGYFIVKSVGREQEFKPIHIPFILYIFISSVIPLILPLTERMTFLFFWVVNMKTIKFDGLGKYVITINTDTHWKIVNVYQVKWFYTEHIGSFHHGKGYLESVFSKNIIDIIEKNETQLRFQKEKNSDYKYNPDDFDGFVTKEDKRINKINKII